MYVVCVCVCVHVRVCVWWAVLCSSYKLYTCEIVSQIGDHSAVIHKRPLNDEGVNRSEPRLQGTMRTGAPKLIQMHGSSANSKPACSPAACPRRGEEVDLVLDEHVVRGAAGEGVVRLR